MSCNILQARAKLPSMQNTCGLESHTHTQKKKIKSRWRSSHGEDNDVYVRNTPPVYQKMAVVGIFVTLLK